MATATATTVKGGPATAGPSPRFVAVCPLARCGYLAVRTTADAARTAERAHWQRQHDRKDNAR